MALLDNLLSYYKLDEASGNALDAHGSDELTDNNSVTSAAGIVGNSRGFNGGTRSFSKANVLNISGDFSLQAWVRADSTLGIRCIVSRRGSVSSDTINYLLYVSSGTLYLVVGHTDNTYTSCVGPVLSDSTWYHVVATHNDSTEELKVYVDNGTPTTQTYSGKTLATTALDSFRVGAQYSNNDTWNGRIDEVGVWDRVLTAGEVEDLYNSGNGLAYEDFAPAPSATPPTAVLGITGYAPTATGDPTLFEYISASSTSSPTASTSIAITSTPPIDANIALLLISCDNDGSGADGDYSQVTGVSDTKGNSWHELAEHSNTNGAAGAGATVSAWYCEVDPNDFSETITTATFSSSIAGRNAAIIYCRSETLSLYAAEVLTAATDASTSYGSLSTSLAAKNRMYVRVCAQENDTSSGFTPTTGFTAIVSNVQAGSGANMGLRAELKIATSAAETSNPSSSFSSDTASVFIALEADAAGGTNYHTAINTYSMTSDTATNDRVTQVIPMSLGVNANAADEVTQITTFSLGINANAADEVTQIVMYSITSQPTPVPETEVLGIVTYAPSVDADAVASPEIPPNIDSLGIVTYAPTVAEGMVGSVTVEPVTPPLKLETFEPAVPRIITVNVGELGITTYEPTATDGMVGSVSIPTTILGFSTLRPGVTATDANDPSCCCCCTVTITATFIVRVR